MKYPLNMEQSLALLRFHARYGRQWKSRLRNYWYSGQIKRIKHPDEPILQQIRNDCANALNTLDIELVRLWVVDQKYTKVKAFLISQREVWLEENDPRDGTDCVTPFDQFLY